jgi:hypothetical protein
MNWVSEAEMTRRVITTATTAAWPSAWTCKCWPVTASWAKGQPLEVAAGPALETAVGLGNTRLAADADVSTPRSSATSN